MYRENKVKKSILEGKNVLGTFSGLGSPSVVELLGLSGLDFIIIDQEHGQGDVGTLVSQLQAISATSAHSIVRVPWNDFVYLKRVQDCGAEGVLIPSIETAEEAAAAVSACRYPPVGRRGSGAASARVSSYGLAGNYMSTYPDNFLLALQIESVKGVENIESILAVKGIDVAFIGPFDLALSAGHPGNMKHPEVAALIDRAEAAIKAAGIPMGTVPHPGETFLDRFKHGYCMVTTPNEVSRIKDGTVKDVKAFREAYPA